MIREQLRARIREALEDLQLPKDVAIPIERPKDERHGDFATPVAFTLAKQIRKRPADIARSLQTAIRVDDLGISDVSIAGGGFINFTLSETYFTTEFEKIDMQGEAYGKNTRGEGININVEFVSTNPTGPLTVGHGRQAALGDVLSNILQETGYDVTREYYFNDAGRQMDLLGKSCYARYMQEFEQDYPFPEDGYRGEYLVRIARMAVEQYGDRYTTREARESRETIDVMRQFAADEIVGMIKSDLEKMGVYFDVWFNESSLVRDGKVEETLNLLDRAGALYEEGGATWFRASDYGDTEDRVLIKSDTSSTYFMTDIAYHINKHQREYPLLINIHGADHHGYVPRMKAAMKALGFSDEKLRYILHQMVTLMEGGEEVKMSTRAGTFVTLRELMDKVGVDATRYFFVMRKADSHLVFDIDLAKKKNLENPVYYVQYVHARIANVFRKAEERGLDVDPETIRSGYDPKLLRLEEEKALIKLLIQFGAVLRSAADHLEPHRLTGFLEDVAAAFHRWYQKGDKVDEDRILTDEEGLTFSRLYLARCTMIIIARGLSLLGVERPTRM